MAPIKSPEKQPWFLQSKPRLFSALFFLLAVPTAVLTLLVSIHVRAELRDQAIQRNMVTAQLIATSVGEEFRNLQNYVDNYSRRVNVIDFTAEADADRLRIKLAEMIQQNIKLSRAFVTDAKGDLITDFPLTTNLVGKNFADRGWFRGAARQTNGYISEIYQRTNMDRAFVLTICTRILDRSRKTVGYLGGQLTTEHLIHWLERISPVSNHRILLLDQQGQPALLDADGGLTLAKEELQRVLKENARWSFVTDPHGEELLACHASVPYVGWTALSLQPTKTIFAPVQTLLKTIAIFFLLSLAGIGVLVFFWFKMVSKYEASRARADAELKTYATNLKRSNDELQALCYSIAHDLRGPLRAISGLAIALKEDCAGQLDAMGVDYVNRLDSSAQRMDELTKALLDYGRLSHVELTMEAVEWEKVAARVLLLLTEEIQAKGAVIEVKKPLPKVRGNPVVMEQVLGNLLSNGFKFQKPGGKPEIVISAEVREQTVALKIRDNGIGIDPAHHKRIFGVFERLHDYQSFPGTGIGLAIVQKGVERIGGHIGVESRLGEGSCFWIELPKA